jgi:hypothetical protein
MVINVVLEFPALHNLPATFTTVGQTNVEHDPCIPIGEVTLRWHCAVV